MCHRSYGPVFDWLIDWIWYIHSVLHRLIDWFVDWLIDSSIARLIDWLMDWLIVAFLQVLPPTKQAEIIFANNKLRRRWRNPFFTKGRKSRWRSGSAAAAAAVVPMTVPAAISRPIFGLFRGMSISFMILFIASPKERKVIDVVCQSGAKKSRQKRRKVFFFNNGDNYNSRC